MCLPVEEVEELGAMGSELGVVHLPGRQQHLRLHADHVLIAEVTADPAQGLEDDGGGLGRDLAGVDRLVQSRELLQLAGGADLGVGGIRPHVHRLSEPVGGVGDAVGIAFLDPLQNLDVVELDRGDAVLDPVEELEPPPGLQRVLGEVDLLKVAEKPLEILVVGPEPDLLGALRNLRQHAPILPDYKRMFRTLTGPFYRCSWHTVGELRRVSTEPASPALWSPGQAPAWQTRGCR